MDRKDQLFVINEVIQDLTCASRLFSLEIQFARGKDKQVQRISYKL